MGNNSSSASPAVETVTTGIPNAAGSRRTARRQSVGSPRVNRMRSASPSTDVEVEIDVRAPRLPRGRQSRVEKISSPAAVEAPKKAAGKSTRTVRGSSKSKAASETKVKLQRDPSTGRYLPRGTSSKSPTVASPRQSQVRRKVTVEVIASPQSDTSVQFDIEKKTVRLPSRGRRSGRLSVDAEESSAAARAVSAAPSSPPQVHRAIRERKSTGRSVQVEVPRVTFVDQSGAAVEKPKRTRRPSSPVALASAQIEQTARGANILRSSYTAIDSEWSDANKCLSANADKTAADAPKTITRRTSRKPAVGDSATATRVTRARSASPPRTTSGATSRRDYATPSLGAAAPCVAALKTPTTRRSSPSRPRTPTVAIPEVEVEAKTEPAMIGPATVRRVRKMAAASPELGEGSTLISRLRAETPAAPNVSAPVVEKLACAAPAAAAGNPSDMLWSYLNA